MSNVKRVYVEKKSGFDVQAKELKTEIRSYLGIKDVDSVRVLIRYDVENVSDETFEKACNGIFSEPPVDTLYKEEFPAEEGSRIFSVEFLPGQFDQRADSAVQCIQFIKEDEQPVIRTACQPSENFIQTHQPLRTRQRIDRADQAADLGRQHPVAETNPPATALQQSADFGIIPQTLHILREQVGRKLQNLARTRFAVPSQAHPVAQMEMRQPAA